MKPFFLFWKKLNGILGVALFFQPQHFGSPEKHSGVPSFSEIPVTERAARFGADLRTDGKPRRVLCTSKSTAIQQPDLAPGSDAPKCLDYIISIPVDLSLCVYVCLCVRRIGAAQTADEEASRCTQPAKVVYFRRVASL